MLIPLCKPRNHAHDIAPLSNFDGGCELENFGKAAQELDLAAAKWHQLENFGNCATFGILHKKSRSQLQKFCYFAYSKNS